MEQSKTKVSINNGWINMIAKPTIGKTVCLLLILTALTLFTACQTTQTGEPTWNDMYEVRSYQIEIVTNEIVTTVFISKFTETNKVISVAKEAEDFGGYEFEYSETNTKDFVDSETPSDHTQIEFQCVDGSCEVKEK